MSLSVPLQVFQLQALNAEWTFSPPVQLDEELKEVVGSFPRPSPVGLHLKGFSRFSRFSGFVHQSDDIKSSVDASH